jgi:hypothetical protein
MSTSIEVLAFVGLLMRVHDDDDDDEVEEQEQEEGKQQALTNSMAIVKANDSRLLLSIEHTSQHTDIQRDTK